MRLRSLVVLVALSSTCYGDTCTVASALVALRPTAEWTMKSNDLSTLVWNSPQTIPTAQEVQAYINDCPNQTNLKQRIDAISTLLNAQDERAKLERAVLLTIIDENNVTRQWITGFKAAVAAAASLADLKTRVAALPDMPDRTVQQAKTAVQNKINSGASD